jgi:PhnB protein
MLTTHIYLNGHCREAMTIYQKAFGATIHKIIEDPQHSGLILHAEITIHNQLLMLNDTGGDLDSSRSGGYQLSVLFDTEEDLLAAYSVLKQDANILFPMQPTDYSECVVRLIDRFDVRWALWV